MLNRLSKFFKSVSVHEPSAPSGVWHYITDKYHADLASSLASGSEEAIRSALNNPMVLYGIEDPIPLSWINAEDFICRLAKRIGILPVCNPEPNSESSNCHPASLLTLKQEIEKQTGTLDLPNCFGWPKTDLGIPYTHFYRVAEWVSIRMLLESMPRSVLEIGAGIGSGIGLAMRYGVKKYTVIDLPTSAVLSAYFTAQTLGEDKVQLYKEPEEAFATWFPSSDYVGAKAQYDLVINANSFTEIPIQFQNKYLEFIAECIGRTGLFFSINHESDANGQRSAREAITTHGGFKCIYRAPFMLRDGYMEEFYRLR